VALGSGASGATLIVNDSQTASGRLGIALALPGGQHFTAGTQQLVVITFNAAANGPTVSTPVSFGDQPIKREVADVNASAVMASYADATATVLQDGLCYLLNPASQSFAANGGTGTVTVLAGAGCAWTASTNDSFITFSSSTTGTGNGTVSFMVGSHTNPTPRSGTITVSGLTFTVLQGAQFGDVPANHTFYTLIGKLSARGVTLGCGGGNYCPDTNVTREQMAAFIIRALGDFNPPAPQSQRFADVPPSNTFYAFIEQMAVRQITLGCGGVNYCPTANVTR